MKKILAAVMVLTGTAAFAQVDATEVGPAIKEEAKDIGSKTKENVKELGKQAGAQTADQGTFKADKAFKTNGDLKDTGREEITVSRAGLPDAVMDIRNDTKVMLDGKKVNAKDLPEGAKITAWFQLEGEETVAVRIDAKSTAANKAMGGSGAAGTTYKKDAPDATEVDDKMKKEADKAEHKMDHEMDDMKR